MADHPRIVFFTWVRTVGAVPYTMPTDRDRPPMRPEGSSPGRVPVASTHLGNRSVGWRVIGANNREMGRGARPCWQVEEAYQIIHAAQAVIDRSVTRFWTDEVGQWFWNISLDDEPIATSCRGYRRQRECVFSVDQFREFFPTAKVVAPHILTPRSTRGGRVILPSILVAPRPKPVAGPTRAAS